MNMNMKYLRALWGFLRAEGPVGRDMSSTEGCKGHSDSDNSYHSNMAEFYCKNMATKGPNCSFRAVN